MQATRKGLLLSPTCSAAVVVVAGGGGGAAAALLFWSWSVTNCQMVFLRFRAKNGQNAAKHQSLLCLRSSVTPKNVKTT